MLDLHLVRTQPDLVRQAIQNKRTGDPSLVDDVLAADEQRRTSQTELQGLQQRLNEASKQIGPLMKAGKRDEAAPLLEETKQLKEDIKALEDGAREADERLHRLMLDLPNVPHESVPVGATPDDNVVAFEWGDKPAFDFEAKPHWELTEQHGLVDFERGAKVTGAGFPFYVGQGARLQRALIAFFLDRAAEAGYTEMQAPLMVNEASGIGTGQIPDKEGMMYEASDVSHTEYEARSSIVGRLQEVLGDLIDLGSSDEAKKVEAEITLHQSWLIENEFYTKLFLIPTAEVPVTNFHRDEILDADALPIRYAAHTPCFRREAGSYGKDVRGLNRLHQFDKVELVRFCKPEDSYDELETLRQDAENLVQALGLPYRRLLMCTGDMGTTQAKKYDLEVWSAGQGRWLEVSSISNFEAYQARRANVRFRPEEGKKPEFVHTLNGSGLALPRIVAALLENNQRPDGTVAVPEVLRPYTRFDQIG
jgi:seryl-tRNA synthetase